jgi:broad specificity phosphatase PhoE
MGTDMRELEVRRHTMRVKPGQHLSQAGIDLARQIGATMGPFDRVITSTIPRAYETAVAMGFAVDEQYQGLSILPYGVEDEVAWDAGFAAFAQAVRRGGITSHYAVLLVAYWLRVMRELPADGRALIITHGGITEAGAVACLPGADHAAWGLQCDYCEGVRLEYDGQRFTAAEILRVKRDA